MDSWEVSTVADGLGEDDPACGCLVPRDDWL
jgi:hypothetical protein